MGEKWDGVDRRRGQRSALGGGDKTLGERLAVLESQFSQHVESSHEWRSEIGQKVDRLVAGLDSIPSDPPRHKEDHDFITAFIEREKRRTERWEKIKAQVGGWAVISGLSGIGYAAYRIGPELLKAWFKP